MEPLWKTSLQNQSGASIGGTSRRNHSGKPLGETSRGNQPGQTLSSRGRVFLGQVTLVKHIGPLGHNGCSGRTTKQQSSNHTTTATRGNQRGQMTFGSGRIFLGQVPLVEAIGTLRHHCCSRTTAKEQYSETHHNSTKQKTHPGKGEPNSQSM